jgi:energy-coupling factor transporter ATP-binding protein EcfA2
MAIDIKELEGWFKARPKWLQDAARRIIENDPLTTNDYDTLVAICLKEAAGKVFEYKGLPADSLIFTDTSVQLRIDSIAEVKGVNALSCSKPLVFGDKPISIVYGRNGSGKSGYIRLLKHICSARRPGPLHGDVYGGTVAVKSAKVTYTLAGNKTTTAWNGEAIADLCGTEIYDTACGLAYVHEENEVSAEPCLLRFFSTLTDVCTRINGLIEEKCNILVSKLPSLPPEFSGTSAGQWYQTLKNDTAIEEIETKLGWNSETETQLAELSKRLAEGNPADKARTIRKQKTHLTELKATFEKCHKGLTDEKCSQYLALKNDAAAKKKAAEQDAEKVFSTAPLEGVGSQSWQLLWDAARNYSIQHAYKGQQYPVTTDNARCVLCQNPMDTETKQRAKSFEIFVKGELQEQSEKTQKLFAGQADSFPPIPAISEIVVKLQAGGLHNPDIQQQVTALRGSLQLRYESLLTADNMIDVKGLPELSILEELVEICDSYEKGAQQLDEDAKGQNRDELVLKAKKFSALKWVNQQRKAIAEEISRLKALTDYHSAQGLTSTVALTRRKSILTEELITQAYIERFQKEISGFGANNIRVEIQKTHAEVGKVYHRLSLSRTGQHIRADEVLSEGELRIVSLSAFLADTEGRDSKTTFIFDDPISSLDHVYEEATAKRLVDLSAKRQVIVFTHRLSLVGMLQKYAEKGATKTEIIYLSKYNPGEVAELPIDLEKTGNAINRLVGERFAELEKAFHQDETLYETLAKALCRDTRVLLERVVEIDLLNGVVRRFSPEVQTKNKIHKLAKITPEDCQFIDENMTKFSRFEHSQSEEAPIPIPRPAEIKADLEAIKLFISELKQR